MSEQQKSLQQIMDFRLEKLQKLKDAGVNPYPHQFKPTHSSQEILGNYETLENKTVVVAGRIMALRKMGKASFTHIMDGAGRIQAYIRRDDIGEDQYNHFKLLDIGDFIGIEGYVFTTKMGEISIHADKITVLAKSIRPLPVVKEKDGETFDAFSDKEQRYRNRHLDLIVNPEVRETFIKRTKIINAIRSYLDGRDFLEVETPVLQPLYGGANARPFVTHHNSLDQTFYLRIADELYLKRLIIGGFEKVYEIGKDFRNEGMDRTHNPEFTVMELYVAYKDYFWMMEMTESLLEKVAQDTHGTTSLTVGDNTIDFKAPYPRVPILEAIQIHTGIDVSKMDENQLRVTAKNLGIEVDDTMGEGKLIDEIFGEKCEHHYIQPTFIIDYPKSMSPLTKEHRDNPKLTERFELMVNGKELANAYSELNDPLDQRERFEAQLSLSEKGDDEAMFIDQDFLRALEYGMPPTSGIGIGIDRLVMLMTNNSSIQEVLFFPQMKPEQKAIPLSEEEKLILDLLKKESPVGLNQLKEQSGLSNKKWDKAIKGLTKNNRAKVTKNDQGLWVESVS